MLLILLEMLLILEIRPDRKNNIQKYYLKVI